RASLDRQGVLPGSAETRRDRRQRLDHASDREAAGRDRRQGRRRPPEAHPRRTAAGRGDHRRRTSRPRGGGARPAMTLQRMKDLRALTDEDLLRRVADDENLLLRERGVAAMGGAPPSPGRMRALRTNVARALTVLSERAIAAREGRRP